MPAAPEFSPRLLDIGGARRAEPAETATNPRARSAVLRVAQKLAVPA
jgi:16S rRNA (cytosine1402-N4)-methyltransferase